MWQKTKRLSSDACCICVLSSAYSSPAAGSACPLSCSERLQECNGLAQAKMYIRKVLSIHSAAVRCFQQPTRAAAFSKLVRPFKLTIAACWCFARTAYSDSCSEQQISLGCCGLHALSKRRRSLHVHLCCSRTMHVSMTLSLTSCSAICLRLSSTRMSRLLQGAHYGCDT